MSSRAVGSIFSYIGRYFGTLPFDRRRPILKIGLAWDRLQPIATFSYARSTSPIYCFAMGFAQRLRLLPTSGRFRAYLIYEWWSPPAPGKPMKSIEMATTKAVRDMSREELFGELEKIDTGNLLLSLDFVLGEIARRESKAQNEELTRMTRQIRAMTAVMAVLTLVVTVATVILVALPG